MGVLVMANATKKELIAEFKILARRADDRLRALEKLSQREYFKPAIEWSYKRAEKDIEALFGIRDRARFNRMLPKKMNKIQIVSAINDVKRFLDAPTSTKRGIVEIYVKRVETINAKYGTNFTWSEYASYLESKKAEEMDRRFGSKTALLKIGEVQQTYKTKEKTLLQANARHEKVAVRDTQAVVNFLLKENGIDIDKL